MEKDPQPPRAPEERGQALRTSAVRFLHLLKKEVPGVSLLAVVVWFGSQPSTQILVSDLWGRCEEQRLRLGYGELRMRVDGLVCCDWS